MSEKTKRLIKKAKFIEAKLAARAGKNTPSNEEVDLAVYSKPIKPMENEHRTNYLNRVLSFSDKLRKEGKHSESVNLLSRTSLYIQHELNGKQMSYKDAARCLNKITNRLERNIKPAEKRNEAEVLYNIALAEGSIEEILEVYHPNPVRRGIHHVRAKISATFALAGILLGVLFMQPSITGNVIGLTPQMANPIGALLFILGVFAAAIFFYQKNHA